MRVRKAAACAVAITVLASGPADANTGRLRCGDNMAGTGFAITVDIDFDQATALIVFDAEYPTQRSRLDITDRYIVWGMTRDTPVFNRFDRVTGVLTWMPQRGGQWLQAGTCQRARDKIL